MFVMVFTVSFCSMYIFYIGHPTSYLACNVHPIFHIYSYIECDWWRNIAYKLFPLLQHECLHGKLTRYLLPQTGPHQNPRHSHLQCPSANKNWAKTQCSFCPLEPRRCRSRTYWTIYDKHQVRHTGKRSVHTSCAPWYYMNTKKWYTHCIVRT